MCIRDRTRQGGVLSPFLFSRYIRDLLDSVAGSRVGCFIRDQCVNILAYADDLVFLAPSWHALQLLLNILNEQCCLSDLTCNASKTVCMIFVAKNRHRMLSTNFLHSKLAVMTCSLCQHFKYLGHSDDDDIQREIHSMFVRRNLLICRFSNCSKAVKLKVFQSFCLCFYDIDLWSSFHKYYLHKFKCCYNKCVKLFFWLP